MGFVSLVHVVTVNFTVHFQIDNSDSNEKFKQMDTFKNNEKES